MLLLMDDHEIELACSEEISSSSSSSSSSSCYSSVKDEQQQQQLGSCSKDEACRDLERLLRLETGHSHYCRQLCSQDIICAARSNAVQWMIKVRNVYGFTPLTVALSVSYFDRYLSKELHCRAWKAWMIELLSVSCVSLAAKMEEASVPLLCDLQIEGLEHLFESKTIQRMELTVLKRLDWRMSSVTAFSFTEDLLLSMEISRRLRIVLLNRINELLLGTLSEVEFLDYTPSVVALCATMCALEEAVPLRADDHKRTLAKILPAEESKVQSCYKLMEELVVDPLYPTHLVSSSQVLNALDNTTAGAAAAGAAAAAAAASAATAKSPVDVITAAGLSHQQQQVSRNDHWKSSSSNNRGVEHDDRDNAAAAGPAAAPPTAAAPCAAAKFNLCSASNVTETIAGDNRCKRKLDEFLQPR